MNVLAYKCADCLKHLFICFFQQGDRLEFLCRCSFLEIYNEQIFDLLDPASSGLTVREDIKKGVFVDGLLERDVASARDAYRVKSYFLVVSTNSHSASLHSVLGCLHLVCSN